MGIRELWEILERARQDTSLKEFRGKRLAVDVSGWHIECHATEYPDRSFFYRILDLLSHGITPVTVFDSEESLRSKQRKRGTAFYESTLPWEQLLTAMGLPVIRANGEAEKVCAQLNSSGIVDGCISNDGDSLAYGATTVLKGYKAKNPKIHLYEMSKIKEQLGLGQEEIIAAAVLLGCDHFGGVKNVGKAMFEKFNNELKSRNVVNILKRMQSWKANEELDSIKELMNEKMKKPSHCPQCSHLGSIRRHKTSGCDPCASPKECRDHKSDANIDPCNCGYHMKERKVEPFLTELKVRDSALSDDTFCTGLEDVISEYTSEDDSFSSGIAYYRMSKPTFPKTVDILSAMSIGKNDISNLFPALVKMTLYGSCEGVEAIPEEIVKKCTKERVLCYLVKFTRFEFDDHTMGKDGYEMHIIQSVFDEKFPDMKPEESETVKSKRGPRHPNPTPKRQNERKITDMLAVTKKGSTSCRVNKAE